MIAVDTSALMAVVLDEPSAEACMAALEEADHILISAGTVAELLVVAGQRSVAREVASIIEGLALDVVPVTHAAARRIEAAYRRWRKGVHPAGLNFGDCFAYDVARTNSCPLLFVGNDFSRTDLQGVL